MKYFIGNFKATNNTDEMEPQYSLIETLVTELPEEVRASGAIVDIPIPEEIEGKISVLVYNNLTGQTYYRYDDPIPQPPTPEERLSAIEDLLITLI